LAAEVTECPRGPGELHVKQFERAFLFEMLLRQVAIKGHCRL